MTAVICARVSNWSLSSSAIFDGRVTKFRVSESRKINLLCRTKEIYIISENNSRNSNKTCIYPYCGIPCEQGAIAVSDNTEFTL